MAVDFYPPALRAQGGSGGLNVTVSPLGLIELSDEEYQVHGARLARYALLWTWYRLILALTGPPCATPESRS